MLNVDLSFALCAFMLAITAASAAAFLSLRAGRTRNGLSLDARHVWLCAICTHIYINTKDDKISVCPRCGSYNSRDAGARPTIDSLINVTEGGRDKSFGGRSEH